MRKLIRYWFLVALLGILAGCAGGPSRMASPGLGDVLDGYAGLPAAPSAPGPVTVGLEANSEFVERGVASFYGKRFHGRKTSSGETFDMNKLTAAHPTLPMDTYAQVINLDNGKAVIVKINDRGPYHGGRVIDLSYAAARKLGFTRRGTVPVEVRAIAAEQTADFVHTASLADGEPSATTGRTFAPFN